MSAQVVPDVKTEDYWLRFNVPDWLMPDSQFDGRPAMLRVHRVRPEYRTGPLPSVPPVVLIHGRTVPGPVVFDLRDPPSATGGGVLNLSVQRELARAGIDTFARACSATADRRTSVSTIPATRASGGIRPTAPAVRTPTGATSP
jgi:hypothetical protein